ncbi:type VI secretion system lipoprotein TssJ [Psychromonas sp.]|uniref:type VI secretion system lipoprotein TssJ n=1 Tax=Psychromonas sp. TaxID=1884585 RepID=UPI0039E3AD5E
MYNFNFVKFLCLSAIAFTLFSCTAANTKVGGLLNLDTDFKLSLIVEKDVNPDDSKVSSPVIVRMYELKTVKEFENANFIDLYEKDTEVLGKSMVTQQSLKPIQPGENSVADFVLSSETQYIGLYVEFLQYQDAKYKVVIPIAKTNIVSSSARVQLSGNRIILLQ